MAERKINDGGPAFPQSLAAGGPFGGLTARDYFAAHCPLTVAEAWAMWTNKPLDQARVGTERAAFWQWFAMMRGEYADAMLAERAKAEGR